MSFSSVTDQEGGTLSSLPRAIVKLELELSTYHRQSEDMVQKTRERTARGASATEKKQYSTVVERNRSLMEHIDEARDNTNTMISPRHSEPASLGVWADRSPKDRPTRHVLLELGAWGGHHCYSIAAPDPIL